MRPSATAEAERLAQEERRPAPPQSDEEAAESSGRRRRHCRPSSSGRSQRSPARTALVAQNKALGPAQSLKRQKCTVPVELKPPASVTASRTGGPTKLVGWALPTTEVSRGTAAHHGSGPVCNSMVTTVPLFTAVPAAGDWLDTHDLA